MNQSYPYLAIFTPVKTLYDNFEQNHINCDAYLETFQKRTQVVVHCSGNFGSHLSFIKYVLNKKSITTPSAKDTNNEKYESLKAFLVMAFLCGLNKDW